MATRPKSTSAAFLSSEDFTRYQRQLIIPEVGEKGQKELKSAKVFLSGVGGLGSISAYYLVAAGVGCLRIVDRDDVETQNLNRQIIHWTNDIGRPKVESAMEKLRLLNPGVHLEPVQEELKEENALDLVGDCSLIIDATDNVETRKVLNRASLNKGVPFICGGVDCFNGMVTTFMPGETACFECLFHRTASRKKTVGVLGPVPGLVASIQTLEAIKIILGMEGTLKGRLLLFSGADMTVKEIKIDKNPDCVVCNLISND